MLTTSVSKRRGFRQTIERLAIALVLVVAGTAATPALADAVKPRILVLTSYEGDNSKVPTLGSEITGTFLTLNSAKAFGYDPANDTPPRADITLNSGIATQIAGAGAVANITPAPQVTFKYGILSPRKRIASDVDATATPTAIGDLVYAKTSVLNATETSTVNDNVAPAPSGVETLDLDPVADAETIKKIFLTPGDMQRYDIIVVTSVYYKVSDPAYKTLVNVMQDPQLKPSSMLFFIDSCCDTSNQHAPNKTLNNARFLETILKPATGDNALSVGASHDGYWTTSVNQLVTGPGGTTGSKYSIDFGASPPNSASQMPPGYPATPPAGWLPFMSGGYATALVRDPNSTITTQDNVLFTWDGNTTSSIYGLFYPSSQIYNNNGTCLFAVLDASQFDSRSSRGEYYVNTNFNQTGRNLGQAFITAALAGGGCGNTASISISPATQTAHLKAPLQPIVLTIKNETLSGASNGDGSISGGRVEAPLPAHLKFIAGQDVITTCKDSAGQLVKPVTTRGGDAISGDSFSVTGVHIGFAEKTCTITLPVEWADTSDIATNACIKASQNTTKLSIATGASQQFSTLQGQVSGIVESSVVCTAPELQLTTTPTSLPGSLNAGAQSGYQVTIANLSETASANAAAMTGLAPAGATPTVTPLSNPAACVSETNCTLAAGESASFQVAFTVPAKRAALKSALNLTPTVALPPGDPANNEVTLANNSVTLSAQVQKQLNVQAQLATTGSADFSSLRDSGMSFTVTACNATPATGNAALGVNTVGAAQSSTADAGSACVVSFTGAPTLLPAGYTLASTTPTLQETNDLVSGAQTVIATWTVVPVATPTTAIINGNVSGAPSPFPAELVGKTQGFNLNCTPGAASPVSGSLTIDASGTLSTTTSPVVPSGSACTLTLTGDPTALPLPKDYEWKAPSIKSSGNTYTVSLVMGPKSPIGNAAPIPTLGQWALLALSLLLMLGTAAHMRRKNMR